MKLIGHTLENETLTGFYENPHHLNIVEHTITETDLQLYLESQHDLTNFKQLADFNVEAEYWDEIVTNWEFVYKCLLTDNEADKAIRFTRKLRVLACNMRKEKVEASITAIKQLR